MKHIQKINVNDEQSIMISDINVREKEIEYYTMKEEIITNPKTCVPFSIKEEIVEFDGIQLNTQYLVKLLNERCNTMQDINAMLELSKI